MERVWWKMINRFSFSQLVTELLYLHLLLQLMDTLRTLSDRLVQKKEQRQSGATFGTYILRLCMDDGGHESSPKTAKYLDHPLLVGCSIRQKTPPFN